MPTINILWEIDAEISRLQQVKELLSGTDTGAVKRGPGRPIGSGVAKKLPAAPVVQPRRKMSAAGRARIAAAMKMRWAKVRKAAKQATATATKDRQKPLVPAALPKAIAKKGCGKKERCQESFPASDQSERLDGRVLLRRFRIHPGDPIHSCRPSVPWV
jgi:hypothetical protein